MFGKATLPTIFLIISGCAAMPDEHALVKDEATAIGKKKCTENQAEVVRHDLSSAKWTARFDAAGGYWWVQKNVMLAPSANHTNVMGLRVLVNAMSGGPISCDLEYMAER
jgi:hypothetical protein